MASRESYLLFILDQLSELDGVSSRKMMGEYLLYIRGKLVGGIYDDRLLLKPTEAGRALLPGAPLEKPYDGGGDMLFVEDTDDRETLAAVVAATAEELPAPGTKKRRGSSGKKTST